MTRRVGIAVGIAAACVVLIGAALVLGRSDRGRENGGPLACPECAGDTSSYPIRARTPATLGTVYLHNTGSEPAILERVELLDADQGIDLVGAARIVQADDPHYAFWRTFPPPGLADAARLVGYEVVPADGILDTVQLLLGVEVARRGSFAFRHVAVDYRVGERRYRAVFRSSLRLCAPITTPLDDCDAPPI